MASCAASASKAALSRLGTVYVSKNRSIFANLAFEEWVFHQHNLEENGDALLVWSNDPAVVVGRHQNPWLEANIPFLDANGIALARRRSGGGTVYHDRGNLNVSLLTSQKQHCRPRNLRRFAESLNRHFGVKIVPNERDDMILQPGDRKISGTAARKAHGRAYHHFTMLVDVDLPFLKKTLKSPWADRIETNATRSVPAKAVGYLGQEVVGVTVEEVQSVVLDTFRSSFEKSVVIESSQVPVDYEKLTWDNVDLREWKWNFGKTPKFTIRLKDGRCTKVEQGVIAEVDGSVEADITTRCEDCSLSPSSTSEAWPPVPLVQSASPTVHFEYLGVEERYDIDSGALKRRFLELQNQVHPDKASAVSEDKKQLFEGHSSRLNSAYKILADPVLRAEYMLNAKEDDKSAESPEFLMEMLEKGEEIEHISSDKKLEVTRTQLLEDVERLKTEMADHFSKAKTDEAAATLVRLRYYLRLLSNVNSRLGFDSK
ncbi:hypothetical protein QR680_007149 [Steinernema hermaphroditum]|uniref:J domain-containing protein n=1 Tax=Steinernema hermaphroditum TaxID=289476 RepID=A0AA39I028_9BILA|nr:hypothetical protein QR680_007149 [Steinernema hermaphroditum]